MILPGVRTPRTVKTSPSPPNLSFAPSPAALGRYKSARAVARTTSQPRALPRWQSHLSLWALGRPLFSQLQASACPGLLLAENIHCSLRREADVNLLLKQGRELWPSK